VICCVVIVGFLSLRSRIYIYIYIYIIYIYIYIYTIHKDTQIQDTLLACFCFCIVCVAPQQPENNLREQIRCILKCRIEVCGVCLLFDCLFYGGSLISIRPIWVYRGATAGVALVGIPSMERVAWSVLTAMPTAIRIVLLDNRWLLLDDL